LEHQARLNYIPIIRIIRKIEVLSYYFAQQQSQPWAHGVFGEHLSPHLQSQHAVLAFAGSGVAGVLPAKLVAVSVNKRPEMKTKSFFMFVLSKIDL
jgi:hypothetical protein